MSHNTLMKRHILSPYNILMKRHRRLYTTPSWNAMQHLHWTRIKHHETPLCNAKHHILSILYQNITYYQNEMPYNMFMKRHAISLVQIFTQHSHETSISHKTIMKRHMSPPYNTLMKHHHHLYTTPSWNATQHLHWTIMKHHTTPVCNAKHHLHAILCQNIT